MLLRIDEPDNGRTIPLPSEPTTIGRGEVAGIRLTEKKASREHARITPVAGGAVVTDLRSTNGTHFEDRTILKARLKPGDAFRIGETWITLQAEDRPPARREGRGLFLTTLGLLGPAVILLVLAEVGLSALASAREKEVTRARQRIERVEYELATREGEPPRALEAMERFLDRHPRSMYAEEARQRVAELTPQVNRVAAAKRELKSLSGRVGGLAFEELYYRYEKLLETCRDVPEVAIEVEKALADLDRTHREKLNGMVAEVRDQVIHLANAGEYGRASSVMTSFAVRSPAAAAGFRKEFREAEAEIMRRAEAAYRDVLARSHELVEAGKPKDAAALLRSEAARFLGMRFNVFLRIRADSIAGRRPEEAGAATPEKIDQLALRRSYYLLAQEAEELAAAGLFGKARKKYEGILESIRLPAIREEFAGRADELGRLSAMISGLRDRIAEDPGSLGTVRLSGSRFRVTGISGESLVLSLNGTRVERIWDSLKPEEVLALLRASRPSLKQRLTLAVYCFDMNLMDEFRSEILVALEKEDLREAAGRLYARKEGVRYPDGGFLPYKGEILTRAEYAEVVHRERIAKLRGQQEKLRTKLLDHPAFRKLAMLRDLRNDLDKARKHALALIFDEKTYFYPYQDRIKEYMPVQEEVDRRVDAVREVWDDEKRFTLKMDSPMKSLLEQIAKANDDLERLGVDATDFKREVERLTSYLGKSMTVRDYYHDEAERRLFEYNRRVLEWNEQVKTEATKMELRQVRITNDYRIMMGRRALVLNELLLRTARGHSEEMSREGYFSHFSPHPERRTPNMRAKIEGYKASALSENIHRGSGDPQGAHNGWVHSSGHHRNLLQKFWTEMATGQCGKYWTQNFGRTHIMTFTDEDEEEK